MMGQKCFYHRLRLKFMLMMRHNHKNVEYVNLLQCGDHANGEWSKNPIVVYELVNSIFLARIGASSREMKIIRRRSSPFIIKVFYYQCNGDQLIFKCKANRENASKVKNRFNDFFASILSQTSRISFRLPNLNDYSGEANKKMKPGI